MNASQIRKMAAKNRLAHDKAVNLKRNAEKNKELAEAKKQFPLTMKMVMGCIKADAKDGLMSSSIRNLWNENVTQMILDKLNKNGFQAYTTKMRVEDNSGLEPFILVKW